MRFLHRMLSERGMSAVLFNTQCNGSDVGEGLFDILIFAGIAAFVLFRLFNVLGRRTGNERPPPSPMPGDAAREQDNVVPLPGLDQQPEDSLAGIDGPLKPA